MFFFLKKQLYGLYNFSFRDQDETGVKKKWIYTNDSTISLASPPLFRELLDSE